MTLKAAVAIPVRLSVACEDERGHGGKVAAWTWGFATASPS